MALGTLAADVMQSGTAGVAPQFNDGGGTQIGTLCRAWVNFNGTLSGTITPRASFNVGSITKNGTGDYTVNFTNAMPDTSYSPQVTVWNTVDGGSTTQYSTARVAGGDIAGPNFSATTVRVLTKATATDTSPGNVIDFSGVFVAVFR